MVVLAVASLAMAVVVTEEDGFVGEVTSKGDSSDTKAGEGALESVPARERTSVSPGLAVGLRQRDGWMMVGGADVLSGPGIVSGLAGGGSELLRVETSEIGTRSHDMRLGDGLLDVSSGCDAALTTSKLQGGYFRARVSVCHACSTTSTPPPPDTRCIQLATRLE